MAGNGARLSLLLVCAFGGLAVAACAKNPDAIAPTPAPVNAFAGLDCDQLNSQLLNTNTVLNNLMVDQRQAVTGDAVGVFLIGVPMSSLTGGDKEGLIAQRKGEKQALEARIREQQCNSPLMPDQAASES
ncbi:hypothetical protein [Oricola indica]|jgi:hypothetical protein|uniref:hypothetical protein n=1 Tax=Oricola indica TaxID=2872591 RepID=UPI001CC0D2E3|nr:hypothetical protein [Oricola indica]